MSWNLSDHDLIAPGERERAQLAHLAQAAPDILCCQKLSGARSSTELRAGFDRFATALGMVGRLGQADGDRLHVAVLWRGDLAEIGPWQPLGGAIHRNAALTTLDVSDGRALQVGTVHLPSRSIHERLEDVSTLLAAASGSTPTLLAGDWNGVGEDVGYDRDAHDHRFDRRVATTIQSAGFVDAARHLDAPWTPTWGITVQAPSVRIDAFRVSTAALSAIRSYDVDDNVDHLSLHRPIRLNIAATALPTPT